MDQEHTIRVIDHLRETGLSNKEAKRALASGKVWVGDAPTADAARELGDMRVRVVPNAPRTRPWVEPIIVHRDEHFAVVAKPSGMLSVPARSRRGVPSVLGVVRRLFGEALPVHRLDEGTSGLMVVALTSDCQRQLKDRLFVHDVERRYLAIVAGDFSHDTLRHASVLVRDRGDGLRGSGAGPDGKRAVSHFSRVRSAGANRTVVEARLETGRTHQIRIHLAELGFPVLGDPLYGPKRLQRAVPRLALHAAVLGFRHPVTAAPVRWEAPLADDLERWLRTATAR